MTQTAAARDNLTRDEAVARASRVSNCTYTLRLELGEKQATYSGDITITFDDSGTGDLQLDHRGKVLHSLVVNGHELQPTFSDYRIRIPGANLQPSNTVHIRYENEFDHAGDGFHQFIDPADGEEYLYSNFEPYAAHRLFPCFDQPDLKATYQFSAVAPADYVVVANGGLVSVEPQSDGRRLHTFASCGPFSTYLFAVIVGRYHRVTEQHRDVEMGLLCRKSMVEHLDTDELFEVTRQGLDFYGEFFAVPYPWGKYDQLFVPEFNAGAMENVAAVTHNEYMVFRDPPTRAQRRERAEVILHEMAHMWFGNLVTMRWWDDLWLNESFATYMSYLCVDRATKFDTAWLDFNSAMKNWAYRQDQLVTTHPIAATVADTDQTFLNFDGITYAKGASVLRQLAAAIGDDGFREGMRLYFRRHAYGNTDLRQFLAALEEGSGRSLGEWSKLWLETASLNTISATYESDGDRVTSLQVTQVAPRDYPTIRPHRIDIGLLRMEDNRIETSVIETEISTAETTLPISGSVPVPGLVLPNINDLAYAKVSLDAGSIAFAREHLEKIDDPLSRQLLWSSLWNMVRDQQLSSIEYLALVREKMPLEPESELLGAVLGQATTALDRYVPDEWREREAGLLFEAALAALEQATQEDQVITWARTTIAAGVREQDVLVLGELLDGRRAIPGLTLDQDMRWSIAMKFVVLGLPGASERIETEAERDKTDRGQRAVVEAEVARPSAEAKAIAWKKFNGEGYGSLYLTRAAMAGFHWWRQREILKPYTERFFEAVPGVFDQQDGEFATMYFRALFPGYTAEQATLDRAQALLDDTDESKSLLQRTLREAIDDLGRTIACREFARQSSSATEAD